jgi:hypothetical protein
VKTWSKIHKIASNPIKWIFRDAPEFL